MDFENLKVAIVHDWLTNFAGAEQVVLDFLEIFPQADIYTSQVKFDSDLLKRYFGTRKIYSSILDNFPWRFFPHQALMIWRSAAFETFDFSKYDLVISSSSAEAKSVITPPGVIHISYIYTPIRYLWVDSARYLDAPGFGVLNPLARFVFKYFFQKLKDHDYLTARRPDKLIAISETVKTRIQEFYNLDSQVIYSAIKDRYFKASLRDCSLKHEASFIVVSRLVSYKRVDLIIKAFLRLDLPLLIIGTGPELKSLKKIAGSNPKIVFQSRLSDEELIKAYQQSRGFVYAAVEDLGLVMVEAIALGLPVIAYDAGGASEIVKNNMSGVLYSEQTEDGLINAINKFINIENDFIPAKIRETVKRFSFSIFKKQILAVVEKEFKKISPKNDKTI